MRFRHYTSRAGSNGIRASGVLKAGRLGKIYAESAHRGVLSPRDAEERYRLRTGRGQDYVEFEVRDGTRFQRVTGSLSGVYEYEISGDAVLGAGDRIARRR